MCAVAALVDVRPGVHLVIKGPRVVKAALLQRERVGVAAHLHSNADVSIRQHLSAYVSIGIVKAALLQRERVGVAAHRVALPGENKGRGGGLHARELGGRRRHQQLSEVEV